MAPSAVRSQQPPLASETKIARDPVSPALLAAVVLVALPAANAFYQRDRP
ncbi:hypothetical protein [Micromonospora sp. NBC_01796]|nr:hypothetical protein [Micromonospora sp. NBC_01796]WSA88335.1 hypothetical protein OIE47_12385 [Micromonospora sp. NBC_01796]